MTFSSLKSLLRLTVLLTSAVPESLRNTCRFASKSPIVSSSAEFSVFSSCGTVHNRVVSGFWSPGIPPLFNKMAGAIFKYQRCSRVVQKVTEKVPGHEKVFFYSLVESGNKCGFAV